MKKHFVFAFLFTLIGGIGIQAQNINPFQVDDFCIHEEASNAPNEEQSEDVIYTVCEDMPEFPGGTEAMYKFIADNLTYTGEINVQGHCLVQFIVEKDGTLSDIEVVRSAGHQSFDQEAVRVVKMMPKWKPGSQRDKIVRCKYTVPVTFKLKNIVPLNSESF